MLHPMSPNQHAPALPPPAIRELEKVEAMDWTGSLTLDGLLARVNRVGRKFLPGCVDVDSRISTELHSRSFRHYQTLGCIDPGKREGRRVGYGRRHLLQALLVRKLLCERVPVERIAGVAAGRSPDELRVMLLGGLQIGPVVGGVTPSPAPAPGLRESWTRVVVCEGIEVHSRDGLPAPDDKTLRSLRGKLTKIIDDQFG